MKLFTLFYFASGQIQGPPGSIPAGRRGVENFDFQDAFGPPGELNLGRKEKNFSQQDIEVIYVSEKGSSSDCLISCHCRMSVIGTI